jgi:hypothetical protein
MKKLKAERSKLKGKDVHRCPFTVHRQRKLKGQEPKAQNSLSCFRDIVFSFSNFRHFSSL